MAVTTPISADAVVNTAISQLGVHEQPANSNKQPYGLWYGMNGQAWCAMFVSWCLHHAGFPISITTPKGFAYCPYGVNYFKQQGAWADKNVRPKRGWIVFFDFPNDGVNRVSHVGIVEGVLADGRIATIEGNTNGGGSRTGGNVMRHNRSVAGGIVGYGIVEYGPVSGQPQPQPDPGQQIWKRGSKGDGVRHIQNRLNAHSINDARLKVTVDGDFGLATEKAVKAFQQDVRLTQDGIVGPQTLAALNTQPSQPSQPSQPTPAPVNQEKERIKRLQQLVGAGADGIWGPNTEAAIKRNYISWKNGPAKKSGAGNAKKELVRFLQQQGNRKFGLGMLEDGLVGGQVNHLIVVSLGQRDGVAGPNAWRALVK